MLKRLYSDVSQSIEFPASQLLTPLDIAGLLRKLWRRKSLILLSGILFSLLALAYCLTAAPLFTSNVSILIEPRQPMVLDEQVTPNAEQVEAAYVDSQVEVLKSGQVLGKVAAALGLTKDPEFGQQPPSMFARALRALGMGGQSSEGAENIEAMTVSNLKRTIDVRRTGLTYVLSVAATTRSPQKSARIANAVADAFLEDNLEARAKAAKAAATWLQERVDHLRGLALAADGRVQDFRARNNIVSASKGLMTDQDVSETGTQLTAARAQLSEAQAKYDKLGSALASGDRGEVSVPSDLPPDSIVRKLQASVIENKLHMDQLAKANGQNHASVQKLRQENQMLTASIRDELQGIGQSYGKELEIARERVKSLEANLAGAVGMSNTAGSAQVEMRDLEREAQSYRAIYQSSLDKLQEAVQKQSFPVSEYRVITAAVPVLQKSWPKSLLTIGLSFLAGVSLGGLISLYLATRDSTMRDGGELRAALAGRHLGTTPRLPRGMDLRSALSSQNAEISNTARALRIFLRNSISGTSCDIIAVISAHRGEGRSTLSASLAATYASAGFRTLLVDADFSCPALTKALDVSSHPGLQSALSVNSPADIAILADKQSGVHFLPSGNQDFQGNQDTLGSPRLSNVLGQLRERFDAIIMDVGPLDSSSDAAAVAPLVDAFVHVVEAHRTQANDVLHLLSEHDEIRTRLLGYVLTNAKITGIARSRFLSLDGRYPLAPPASA